MPQLFNGTELNRALPSGICIAQWKIIEHFAIICEFYSEYETSTMADGINYTGDLQRYVLVRLFDNLTDKSY